MADFNPQPIKTTVDSSQNDAILAGVDTATPHKTFYQSNKFYILAIFIAVIVMGALAYFAFRPLPAVVPTEANVSVQIQAPESLPSGGEAVYRITVRNDDSVKLTGLEMELAYPEGVAYLESSPKASNYSGSVFKVPDLLPQQNAGLIIKTKISGDINSEKRLLARLRYKYSNFNSSFVKEAVFTLRLTASNVVLEMDGPKEVNTSQVVVYSIIYKNNSEDVIKNARIKLAYPIGFNYASSQPEASLGGNIWNIGDLQGKSEGKITLQGTFAGSNSGEEKKITAELQTLGSNGEYFVQNTAEARTSIISQPLLVSLENLNQSNSNVVWPGETLDFSVRYQNNSPVAALGVNIMVTLDSKAFDLSSLRAQGGQIVGNNITWNAAGVPGLESLNPSESGSLSFSVRVNNPAVKDSTERLSVKFTSKIKANEFSTFLPGGGAELKIASPSRIETQLEYLSGSLPPKVGTQTKYKVKIKLINSSNDFSSSEFTAFLPAASGTFNQDSVNAAERGSVQFDSSTGKMVWKAGLLAAYSGKFNPARILEFELSINPSLADAGDRVALVRNIKLSAKDDYTETNVEEKTEDITTASLSGQSGYYNGIVAP